MKTTEYIAFPIDRPSECDVFAYADFVTEVSQKGPVIIALNRMVDLDKVVKLANSNDYKLENTPFGNLQPSNARVVKVLLEDTGKYLPATIALLGVLLEQFPPLKIGI